jgi:hypothetical protein
MLKPKKKQAILRIYRDDDFSDLELALMKQHLRALYRARFGENPQETWVNCDWKVERVAVPDELPDELLSEPVETYDEEYA